VVDYRMYFYPSLNTSVTLLVFRTTHDERLINKQECNSEQKQSPL